MAGLEDVVGPGSTARQLFEWAVLQAVVASFFAPYIQEITSQVWARHPDMPMSAPEAATAVNRSFMTEAAGASEAAKQGVSAEHFSVLQHLAGNAPSPTDLVTALRRGVIDRAGAGADSTSFEQGIREGNLLDKWTDVVAKLAAEWPSPAEAARAALQGQVSRDEGKALYEKFGGDPQWYDLVFNTEGSAPTPEEAVGMALRGIIPWNGTGPGATTYEQAFLEGPWRNKWEGAFRGAALWWPTIGEAMDLYRYGQIDRARAAEMLTRRGLSPEDAASWIGYADANAVDDYRGLTESAVLTMLSVSYITDEQARSMLKAVHKGPAAIDTLISYAHIQRAIQSINQAVSRIGNLYQSRKITESTARDSLLRIKIPATAVNDILADWSAVAAVNVRTLTESQIVDAWAAQIMSQDEAMTELTNIGYTPFDAWVLLSIKHKSPLPGQPAPGPAAPIGAVSPGTT